MVAHQESIDRADLKGSMDQMHHPGPWLNALRWLARIWSLATIAIWSSMLIAELAGGNFGSFKSSTEVAQFIFCPTGVCVGLVIAFKREAIGGLLTTASIIAFHIFRPDLLFDLYIDGLALPGVLFLVYGAATRRSSPHR